MEQDRQCIIRPKQQPHQIWYIYLRQNLCYYIGNYTDNFSALIPGIKECEQAVHSRNNYRLTPAQFIAVSFLLVITLGTLLLMLPCATAGSGSAPLLDALFTATSATCVTGLVVHDTATYWSMFGHLVIMILMQTGGMGVMTIAISFVMLSGRKIGLKQRWAMQEALSAHQVGGIIHITRFIVTAAIIIEATGAALLALRFCPQYGLLRGLWYAVFHSVAAFCNSGFDLMGINSPFSSLTGYSGDLLVNLTVTLLVLLGGIGFLVWHDLYTNRRNLHYCMLQTKLIVCTISAVIALTFLYYMLYEFNQPQWAHLSLQEKLLAAFFQSASSRTSGFCTLDYTNMSEGGLLLTIAAMMIGGAPGSTAGGFKVTTMAVLLLSMVAVFRHQENANCFGRRIGHDVLRSASAIFMLYMLLFWLGGFLICSIEDIPMLTAMFESASAVGTVGLSLGITPELSSLSRLIIIMQMYFGRVGGLTMIYAMTIKYTNTHWKYPEERVFVG